MASATDQNIHVVLLFPLSVLLLNVATPIFCLQTFGSSGRSLEWIEGVDVEADMDRSVTIRVDQLQGLSDNLKKRIAVSNFGSSRGRFYTFF